MDKEYFEVCLCSLFHDIGKFAWRCASEEESKSNKGERLSHEDWNKRIVRTEKISFSYWSKDYTPEMNCVWLGDWISAQEREDLDEEEIQDKEESFTKTKTTPLLTIFSGVAIQTATGEKKLSELAYCIPKNLSLKLPSKEDYTEDGRIEFDKRAYGLFENQIRLVLRKYNIEDEAQRYSLLREATDTIRRYLINIPSATWKSRPNIDLYNHSKTASAISACLYKYYGINTDKNSKFLYSLRKDMAYFFNKEREIQKEKDKKEQLEEGLKKSKEGSAAYNKRVFLLVSGNFSGIQDFISTIATSKAIKMLKSRSFYLSFLNRSLPLKLAKELDLPEMNILFSDGGNFEILAPNTEETISKIKNFANEFNTFLWGNFGVKLFLQIDCKELSARSFAIENFSNETKSDEAKKNRIGINSKDTKFLAQLNAITDSEGNQKLEFANNKCDVCSKEVNSRGEDKKLCDSCEEFENLRSFLKEWQKNKSLGEINLNILKLGGKRLTDYFKYSSRKEFYPVLGVDDKIYEIFPMGLPLNELKDVIDFETILNEVKKRTGTRKLGALKLDVDNLGKLFSEGLKDKLTLSTYSALSFRMSFFFSGIVPSLREEDNYKEDVYIIYSGGDDSFIIGAWDKVLDFARDVYSYFKIYVNHHPAITISASYGIFNPKYPVKKIFETLDYALDKAKSFDSEKGRLTLFGEPIKWDYFEDFGKNRQHKIGNISFEELIKKNDFEIVLLISDYFTELVGSQETSRGLLQRINDSAEEILHGLKERIILPVWRMDYYLKRNIKGEQIQIKIKELWKKICLYDINGLLKNNGKITSIQKLKLLQIAVRLSQLKTKELKMKGGKENV